MQQKYDTVITAKQSPLKINFKELIAYKYLIFLFVKRDFIAKYKQTVLGPLWAVIQPFLTTVVFTAVFGNLAGFSTGDVPAFVFYLCSNVLWHYFSASLNACSTVLVSHSHMLTKVYFPRLVLPISSVISKLISFAIQLCFFLVFFGIYAAKGQIEPNIFIILTPLFVLHTMLLSLGVGMLISACTIKYRDLTMLISFAIQLWMYASPVIYTYESVPEKWQTLMMLNPLAPVIEAFRYAFLGCGNFYAGFYIQSCITTAVIFLIGLIVFNKAEKNFADTV
ncbi:MAG: ABC transporter permease [Oscillospiraceae bacterium]|nr:ABC transporter permease [Oscillospiraceae bacterium]